MILTIVISGTIASILVERKMKEGKGLQKINLKDHLIICGWNKNAVRILHGLQAVCDKNRSRTDAVLVNDLDIDSLNELQFTYAAKYLSIEFVRGNFKHEQTLENANVRKARSILLLADRNRAELPQQRHDERVVLAAYTINNIKSGAASVQRSSIPRTSSYLKRTKRRERPSSMGVQQLLLITPRCTGGAPGAQGNDVLQPRARGSPHRIFPPSSTGKHFQELFNFIRDRDGGLLIGVISESRKLSIDDFLPRILVDR